MATDAERVLNEHVRNDTLQTTAAAAATVYDHKNGKERIIANSLRKFSFGNLIQLRLKDGLVPV